MKPVIRSYEEANASELGGKGAALASAARAGMPVPPWFAVAPVAHTRNFEEELRSALAELCPRGELVAVRSSALDEDGAQLSFAGQLESHLFVRPEQVPERIADVWRSAFAPRAAAYREQLRGGEAAAPAVLVQRMVAADVAGVAFSADPVSGRRALAVVAAAVGVGTAVVSGEADADTFHVDRPGRIASRRLAGARPCLSDAQVAAIAALARRCARHFGQPQDIEWAIEGGCLWLLQSRPITSLHTLADPDGELAIWDSSNIAESYGGVTTPLTFSFIRRCYEHVYRSLGRLGGVAEEAIRANDDAYRRMLGFMRGRVYYNLLAWYRLLALAPGFRYNRRFLDEMLGVGVHLDASCLPQPAYTGLRSQLALLRQAFRSLLLHFTVERVNARFRGRLEAALELGATEIEELRADELVAHFRALEEKLLTSWDGPLVNDFFAMIFHGLLRRLVARWLGPGAAGIDNDLLGGEGGVISVEPVRLMQQMARVAVPQPGVPEVLREGTRDAALAAVRKHAELDQLFIQYLERFADRCPEELKLESLTLRDDPLPLLRAVGHLAAAKPRGDGNGQQMRKAAEARVAAALGGHPLRRLVFGWVLRNTRARVRDRENLRFERTRVFARVRRIAVELGKRLHALRKLDSPRDVFYLELDELLGYVDGTATCADLRALCALRKAEFERQQGLEAPPRRFETREVGQLEFAVVAGPSAPVDVSQANERRGTACSAGVVRGRARVVRNPESARLAAGEILVAERTDPGWVLLFAAAAGLVVERGSLLSHAAIVAREMALPAVVGVSDACAWLRDGDLIEIDGAAGIVRRIAA